MSASFLRGEPDTEGTQRPEPGTEKAAGSSLLCHAGGRKAAQTISAPAPWERGAGRRRFRLRRRVPAEVFLLWGSKRRPQTRRESPLVLEEQETEKDFCRLAVVRRGGPGDLARGSTLGASRTGQGRRKQRGPRADAPAPSMR